MERLLIILAVLVCVAAAVAVARISARGRRPPLRMDGELDVGDEDLLIGSVGAPRSPIDRAAQVLDAQMLDSEPVEAPRRVEGPAEPSRRGPPDRVR